MSSRDIIQAAAGVGGGDAVNPNAYKIEYLTQDDINTFNIGTSLPTANNGSSVTSYNGYRNGLVFDSDGTNFITTYGTNRALSFSLDTSWDFETLNLKTPAQGGNYQFFTFTTETSQRGMWVKPDGTRLYICGIATDAIQQYNLSTAWDLSTASLSTTSSTIATQLYSMGLSSDGSYVWATYAISLGVELKIWPLSTAWEISSMGTPTSYSYIDRHITRNYNDEFTFKHAFKPDGTRFYMLVEANTEANGPQTFFIGQFDFDTAWDATSLNVDSIKKISMPRNDIMTVSEGTATRGAMSFSNDGTRLFIFYNGLNYHHVYAHYTLSTPWDITTLQKAQNVFFMDGQVISGVVRRIFDDTQSGYFDWSSDGKKLYATGPASDRFEYRDLTTAYDARTMGDYSSQFNTYINVQGFRSTQNDTELIGIASGAFHKLKSFSEIYAGSSTYFAEPGVNLPTLWLDLADATTHEGIKFIDNGNKVLFGPGGGNFIQWLPLTTAYDLSTIKRNSHALGNPVGGTQRYSMSFNGDGTKLYMQTADPREILEISLASPYDLGSYATTNKLINLPGWSASTSSTTSGWCFGDSGTKAYFTETTGDKVWQLELTTAYELETAIQRNDTDYLDVSGQETNPDDIAFKSDGTVLYVLAEAGNGVDVYNLSTAWDITSATYDTFYSLVAYSGSFSRMKWSPDGSKFYFTTVNNIGTYGESNDRLWQLNCTTSWDLSTASYGASTGAVIGDATSNNIAGFEFNSDGTKIYLAHFTPSNKVYELTLTTAYDISTIIWPVMNTNSNFFSPQRSVSSSIASTYMTSDGTKLFICDSTTDDIWEYELDTAYNFGSISNVTQHVAIGGTNLNSYDTAPGGIMFGNSGTYLYVCGRSNNIVMRWTLSTAYDITTASSYVANTCYRTASIQADPYAITFNSDGTKCYIADSANTTYSCLEYVLSTAWDLSDISSGAVESGGSITDNPTLGGPSSSAGGPAPRWFSNGTKALFSGYNWNAVTVGTFSTAYDMSTVTVPNDRYTSGFSSSQLFYDIYVSSDGYTFWTLDSIDRIHEWTTSVAFSIDASNITYTGNNINLSTLSSSVATNIVSFNFTPDGTKIHALDQTDWCLYEFTLNTAWDITDTVTYNSSNIVDLDVDTVSNRAVSPRNMGTTPWCFRWSHTGEKAFIWYSTGSSAFIIPYSIT